MQSSKEHGQDYCKYYSIIIFKGDFVKICSLSYNEKSYANLCYVSLECLES